MWVLGTKPIFLCKNTKFFQSLNFLSSSKTKILTVMGAERNRQCEVNSFSFGAAIQLAEVL